MVNLRKWSVTATGNASVAGGANTINFAEGQTPGSVNNSAREMMAQLRSVYTPSEWGWVENSATASVASQTTFKLAGNQTTDWVAPRRWRLKSGSTTRYGTVVSSSYTVETTVTVTVDSGSLSASHSLAALAAIDANHIPATYVTSASLSSANYVSSNSASAMIAAQIAASPQGFTLLGTLTTTSGTSQTLSGLTLTSYKKLHIVFNGVSHNSGTGVTFSVAGVAVTSNTAGGSFISGYIDVDLTTGYAIYTMSTGGLNSSSLGITTATTSIVFAPSSGSFDAGSITAYGVN